MMSQIGISCHLTSPDLSQLSELEISMYIGIWAGPLRGGSRGTFDTGPGIFFWAQMFENAACKTINETFFVRDTGHEVGIGDYVCGQPN